MKLNIGNTVSIVTGGKCNVLEQLGEGGQGLVYKVTYNNNEYALKWYHKPCKQEFYDNLKRNIDNGTPASNFLWPLFLTEKDSEGCFGYLMELRPSDYKEFSDFLLAKAQFRSVEAMIEAGIKICTGFRKLHNKGYSYQDLNDGNFFINPVTGDVLICDNDNVAPAGTNMGILGKCRYMAPEIVRGDKLPDAQSDRFSLAVILFLLFFNNHPLEGRQIISCPCLTEKHEKKFYGTNPLFIYDPDVSSNAPVGGIHVNVINLWQQFPVYVRDLFTVQFSRDTMHQPGRRITEKEWLEKLLLRMRNELIVCPYCRHEIFAGIENDSFKCEDCGNIVRRPPVISSGIYRVAVCKDKKIYQYITDQKAQKLNHVSAVCVESQKTPGLFGLRNQTEDIWMLTTKSGKTRPIAPGEVAPLLTGNTLSFGNGTDAQII